MATNMLARPWNFEVPDVQNFLRPVQQGMRDMRAQEQQDIENRRADENLGMQRQRLGMEQERFNIDKQQRVKEAAGNFALLYDPKNDQDGAKWKSFIATHPNASGLDAKYHDPATGRLAILADANMAQRYLENQIAQAAAARAAAAEGRASAMHVPQLETAKIQAESARRELDAPKSTLNIVPEGGTLVATNPRTGQHQIVASGAPKELKDFQTRDAMWAERMKRSESNIDDIAGVDRTTGKPLPKAYNPARGANRFAPDDPSIWNLYTANLFNSTNWQRYQQAAREGIAAVLRKDTGAAVTPDEWNLYFPMYYPQPGDSPRVVLQKKQAREAATRALRASSGPAYDRMFPEGGAPAPQPTQAQQPANSPPAVGAVEMGYRFKGGDPSNPSSWEKAQ